MKTILIAVLALGFGVAAALAETQGASSAQLAGQSSTTKPNSQPDLKLKAKKPSGGQSRIVKGGCCAKVNNQCVTICGKAGGCTGVGDCITNPN
jgi:hypothetical protein